MITHGSCVQYHAILRISTGYDFRHDLPPSHQHNSLTASILRKIRHRPAYPSPVQIMDAPGILGNDIVGATLDSPLVVPLNSTGGTIVLERNQARGAQPAIWLSMDVDPSNISASPSIALQVDFNIV